MTDSTAPSPALTPWAAYCKAENIPFERIAADAHLSLATVLRAADPAGGITLDSARRIAQACGMTVTAAFGDHAPAEVAS